MADARAEIEIDKPAEAVWSVVGDFGGLAGWMPGIESCVVDGDDRILKLMGMEVTERLERKNDDERVLVYRIVGGVPVENHRATITVASNGTGSSVTWDVEVEPDDMAGLLQGMYQQALQALKEQVGG
ncbi:MAG TPA: SRPBCC family protein [Acidimicrobiales bacterium]|nr:SRPBCC family protein [Acidimicrobiales bacterium]